MALDGVLASDKDSLKKGPEAIGQHTHPCRADSSHSENLTPKTIGKQCIDTLQCLKVESDIK